MRYALVPILVAILTVQTHAQRRPRRVEASTNPLGMSEAVIEQGRQQYNSSCTACHGLDGDDGDRAPALKGRRRFVRSSDQDLYEAIRNGIKGTLMPASPLKENEVWTIVAYVRSLRASAFDAPVEGSVERGREIFWGSAKCGGCHMIQGRGGLIGPDLSNLGDERTGLLIREALTKPRLTIPQGYRPAAIVTVSGETVEGIVKNDHNFSVQMLDRQMKLRLFTSDEIRRIDYGAKSLMPTDWEQRLKPEEFKDLVAFLSRQAKARGRERELPREDLRR